MFNNLENRHTSFSCSEKPMGISFLPVKNVNGNFNYTPVLNTLSMKSDATELKYKTASIPTPVFALPPDDDNRRRPDIYSIGDDMIKTFYVGSVTIVGLFILYRILQKSA